MNSEETHEINQLRQYQLILGDVQDYIISNSTTHGYAGLTDLLEQFMVTGLGPLAILPLASCNIAGGNPRNAIPVSAAWIVLNYAIRILDDMQDQDHPILEDISPALQFHYVASLFAFCNQLLTLASWSPSRFHRVQSLFNTYLLQIAHGQEQDIQHKIHTIEDYWKVVIRKNGLLFAMACGMGAICGDANSTLLDLSQQVGLHLGNILQLFDDFEGTWIETTQRNDLEHNRVTLPLLYGLTRDHPDKETLQKIVDSQLISANADSIRQILDAIHARDYIISVALQERKKAMQYLDGLSESSGKIVLETYFNTIFTDIDELLLSS